MTVQQPENSKQPFLLAQQHDGRHFVADRPHARESLVFMLQLPTERIAAFIYTWVSGDGKAGTALSVYGDGVEGVPIFEACDGIPVPPSMTFDDWTVGNIHVRHIEPLQTAQVRFRGERASIDYHFDAMHPAYNYGASVEGCPPWMAADRFEQSGRVRGTLWIGDRAIPFNTFGHRDHSWGTRDWGQVQQSKWLEAQTEPDVAINVFEYAAVGRTGFMGYVQKQGRIAEVSGLRIEFNLDAERHHTDATFVIDDTAGRQTVVKGKTFALYEFKVSPLYTLNEGSMSVEIDGVPGVGHLEMGWPKAYLDYLRASQA